MTFTLEGNYVAVNCGHENGGCGLAFAMTEDFYNTTRKTGQAWYCPNGHRRVWGGPNTTQKLAEAQARETALQDQLTASIREAEASRMELLRIRSRIANGVCPCCNRSFENVRRHIATQHPDYAAPSEQAHRPVRYRCSCGYVADTYRGLRIHQGKSRTEGGAWAWDKPGQVRWASHLTTATP